MWRVNPPGAHQTCLILVLGAVPIKVAEPILGHSHRAFEGTLSIAIFGISLKNSNEYKIYKLVCFTKFFTPSGVTPMGSGWANPRAPAKGAPAGCPFHSGVSPAQITLSKRKVPLSNTFFFHSLVAKFL